MSEKTELEYNFPGDHLTNQKLSYTRWGRLMYQIKAAKRAAGEKTDYLVVSRQEYEAYMKHRGKVYLYTQFRGKVK